MFDTAIVGAAPSVVRVEGVALYDARGRIHHMHHVVILEGARPQEPDALKREAVSHARSMGHDVSRLKALHVADLRELRAMYRVDAKKQVLVEIEPPRTRRRAPARKAAAARRRAAR
jgi:hypothetical protein